MHMQMKMEHVVRAPAAGTVTEVHVEANGAVVAGQPLLTLARADTMATSEAEAAVVTVGAVRPDLAEVEVRHSYKLDVNRPSAVAKRRATGQRTARENVAVRLPPSVA